MGYYDEIADGYDELHREEQLAKYRALESLGCIASEESILDLGHGSGLICEVFDNPIVGIDSSKRLLARSPAKVYVHSFDDPLPFDDSSFDWVVSFTALHHARDPRAVLAEADRIARSGIAISVLRALPSFGSLRSLFAGWDSYDAGSDALFVWSRASKPL